MLLTALRHELRLLRGSRSRIVALLLFLGVGVYAALAAQRSGATWQETVDAAVAAEQESVATVRGWFARGEKGPSDRPWVDVSNPRYMDFYAGTRMARAPVALAGISGGVGDDMPVAVPIRSWGDPFGAAGVQIENPEFDRSTRLDLGFLVVVLIPLLIGVLALGIGARERELGLDRMLAMQGATSSSWYLARSVAATAIALGAVGAVAACVVVLLRPDQQAARSFVAILLLYTLLWGGLHTLVSATCHRLRDAAVGFGLTWTVLCILIPVAASEWAISSVSDDYAVDLSLDIRRGMYDIYERDLAELTAELYQAFPELGRLPAAQEERLPRGARRQVYTGLRLLELEARHARRQASERAAARKARHARWVSPALAARLGLDRLAGADAEAAARFRAQTMAAFRHRVRWILTTTWQGEPLLAEDFERLLAETPGVVETPPSSTAVHLQVLAGWGLLVWVAGALAVRRQDRGR